MNKKSRFSGPLFLLVFFYWTVSCGFGSQAPEEVLDGERLAQIHCGSCHQFPSPGRLDKLTWRNRVLPRMAMRLGISDRVDPYGTLEEVQQMKDAGIYPDGPLLDSLSWLKISDYYLAEAPDSLLDQGGRPEIVEGLDQFELKPVDLGLAGGALTTLLHWDAAGGTLYVGDGRNQLFRLRGDGTVMDIHQFNSPPVAVQVDSGGGVFVLTIGFVRPSDEPRGRLSYLHPSGDITVIRDELPRPVDMAFADLDGDGLEDLVICGFGHFTGRLSWFRQLADNEYEERVLINTPGAIKTHILDFDGDGRPDILTLLAQGDERIVVHYNEGMGHFRRELLLRFDPVFGSAFFEPVDFDGDGDLDILYTNGDNADYSFGLKPYHGIRLFENRGDNTFQEAFFFPLHGAFKTATADFDGDGDLDIAAIAFFPDYSRDPEASFVYLENITGGSGYTFLPSTFKDRIDGRWLIMDGGDFNGDGLPDIALGSFTYSPTPTPETRRRYWADAGLNVMLMYGSRTVNGESPLRPFGLRRAQHDE